MNKRFSKISSDAFANLQIDAGVLLRTFDPSDPKAPSDADIITATTGGITAECIPQYSDFFEDVDNAPNNTMEGKHLDGWNCRIATSCLTASVDVVKMALGPADAGQSGQITPRSELQSGDFSDLWYVGDRADGGLVAIKLKNALSTGGFSLKTTKNGKGTFAVEITGHVSISDLNTVPMEFYIQEGE